MNPLFNAAGQPRTRVLCSSCQKEQHPEEMIRNAHFVWRCATCFERKARD